MAGTPIRTNVNSAHVFASTEARMRTPVKVETRAVRRERGRSMEVGEEGRRRRVKVGPGRGGQWRERKRRESRERRSRESRP
jgi:hypothetical protein